MVGQSGGRTDRHVLLHLVAVARINEIIVIARDDHNLGNRLVQHSQLFR